MFKNLEDYILEHSDDEDPVLSELSRFTHLNVLRPRMLSGHIQGSLLRMICRMLSPSRILEIGTYTGYSSICMAFGTHDNARIYTIEKNDELKDIILSFFQKAGVQNRIDLFIGDALAITPDINEIFDLVFIDGDKRYYCEYYEVVFPKLKPGGFIVADNTLWGGKVSNPSKASDDYTKGVMLFNQMIKSDLRVEKIILPLRDGLSLIRKII